MLFSRFLVVKLVLAALLFPSLADAVKAVRVIDGDTIELANGETVRYIGIDAPETLHPSRPVEFMGLEAAAFNRTLVSSQDVRLEFDVQQRDHFGRLLAYVYVNDIFVNAELVRSGYARVATYPPNVRHVDLFVESERRARQEENGLWDPEARAHWVSPQPSTDPAKLYLTRSGERYHLGSCGYLSRSAIETTLEDAIRKKYGPCKVCIK